MKDMVEGIDFEMKWLDGYGPVPVLIHKEDGKEQEGSDNLFPDEDSILRRNKDKNSKDL